MEHSPRRFHVILVTLTLMNAFARADSSPATQPTFNEKTGFHEATLTSEHQSVPTRVEILLPSKLDPQKKYPVLYVLPVAGPNGQFGDGLIEAKKANVADRYGVICVSPFFSGIPWIGNHATDVKNRQEDYVLKTLVPFIDRAYPTQADAEGRWLIGFSKSGWAACTLLMRHRETFGYAAAWDVPFMIDGRAKEGGAGDWGPMGLKSVMGTPEQLQQFLPTTLAVQHADELRPRTRLVIGVGEFWKPQCIAMHELLEKHDIPHTYLPDLVLKHRWDTGWFGPTMDALAKLATASW